MRDIIEMRAKVSDRDKTISDFGDQWMRHTENPGYYGSVELFDDLIHPFLTRADFAGRHCAEIGSGTGRIVRMMLAACAGHVTAMEPSRAFEILVRNTAEAGDRVTCLNVRGEEIPESEFDIILSIGVLHHIPDPKPVVDAAWRALHEGGTMLIWVYGQEGSRLYRSIFQPMRLITRRLPIGVNEAIARAIYTVIVGYIALIRRFPRLPLSDYLRNVYLRFDANERRLVILDQINPQWARYYRKDEAIALLRQSGFRNVEAFHRHGYSWTVIGTK